MLSAPWAPEQPGRVRRHARFLDKGFAVETPGRQLGTDLVAVLVGVVGCQRCCVLADGFTELGDLVEGDHSGPRSGRGLLVQHLGFVDQDWSRAARAIVAEDADPWDETNWPAANPEAKNDPSKENAFRQYRLNQWVQQAHR